MDGSPLMTEHTAAVLEVPGPSPETNGRPGVYRLEFSYGFGQQTDELSGLQGVTDVHWPSQSQCCLFAEELEVRHQSEVHTHTWP